MKERNTIKITDVDMKVVRGFAENDMNSAKTAEALFMHRNTITYHLDKVKYVTGLNPYKFYDLVKLVQME